MTERLARFGIAPIYRPHLRHFMERAKAWGLSRADVDAHLEFAAALPERVSDEELMTRYQAFAERRRIPPEIAGLATEWRAQVATHGIEAFSSTFPFSENDQTRLAAIENEMRKPRAESAYWRDPAMRDEYLDLLERRDASGTNGAQDRTGPHPNDHARKAAIEAAMREGRGGSYFRSGSPLPDEYRAILEREAAPSPSGESAARHDDGDAASGR